MKYSYTVLGEDGEDYLKYIDEGSIDTKTSTDLTVTYASDEYFSYQLSEDEKTLVVCNVYSFTISSGSIETTTYIDSPQYLQGVIGKTYSYTDGTLKLEKSFTDTLVRTEIYKDDVLRGSHEESYSITDDRLSTTYPNTSSRTIDYTYDSDTDKLTMSEMDFSRVSGTVGAIAGTWSNTKGVLTFTLQIDLVNNTYHYIVEGSDNPSYLKYAGLYSITANTGSQLNVSPTSLTSESYFLLEENGNSFTNTFAYSETDGTLYNYTFTR